MLAVARSHVGGNFGVRLVGSVDRFGRGEPVAGQMVVVLSMTFARKSRCAMWSVRCWWDR